MPIVTFLGGVSNGAQLSDTPASLTRPKGDGGVSGAQVASRSVGCCRHRRRCHNSSSQRLENCLHPAGARTSARPLVHRSRFFSTSILCESPCELSVNILLERCASKELRHILRGLLPKSGNESAGYFSSCRHNQRLGWHLLAA